jgi:hypothetical protein
MARVTCSATALTKDSSVQSLNYNMWVKSVTLGNYLMKSDGSTLFGGSIFFSNVLLLGDGFALGDGLRWVMVTPSAMVCHRRRLRHR